jgi:hypothetical protein
VSSLFLESVLPSTGTYCAVSIRGGKVKQTFAESIEEVEKIAQDADDGGSDAYFALASFSSNSRKTDCAEALRAVFIDIDCGPGKPYPEIFDAAQALRAFIGATGFPDPIVVNSGGGIHAYWPFIDDVPVADWLPTAKAFKALCVQHKLGIDLTVTADAARILRVPGTHNYKQEAPRPVQIATLGSGPMAFSQFRSLLPASVSTPAAPVDLSAAKAFGVDEATKAMAKADLPKAKFVKLVKLSVADKGCAQIKHAVVDAAELEEPLWRAALSIAWNCVDGETAIHKLSKPHPEYTFDNTVEKAQRLDGKPYKCAWYRDNSPALCQGCKLKVTSPIQLGAFVEEAPVAEDGSYQVEAVITPDDEEVATTAQITIPQYPFPYFRGKTGGVYAKVKDEDGNELPPLCIYDQDLYVTSRFYDSDENDGDGELVGINLHLPHDGVRRFHATSVALFAKDKLRDTLVKHGVIAYGKQLDHIMGYLAASVKKLQSASASSRTRSQMGWTSEGTFVVGELEYTPHGIKLAPAASGTRQMAPLFHQKGSLDEWAKIVNFYNRPGMEGHAFAFLVGAGSPLLQLLNSTQVRGAVLNLVSNKSGTGKTTVQMAINSIFGHPTELLMEAKDTSAARFHRLGTLNSICMTVDELTNATGEQLSHLVYGSTSGRAPHRMEAQSNRLRNNNTTWCSFTVTSSNAVMSDALASHRSAVEGELKRVIDLHIKAPGDEIPKEETDALFGALANNYGVAGPLLAQYLVMYRDDTATLLQEMQMKIDREAGLERSDRFYSAVLAVAMSVAKIGNRLKLWALDEDRIYAYAIKAVQNVKESNRDTVGSTETLAIETLAKYISDNISNALVINSRKSGDAPPAPSLSPKGSLKMRYEPNTDELTIIAADLRAYFVGRRVDFKASMQSFADSGALIHMPGAKDFTLVRRIAAGAVGSMGAPATRCYVFKGEALGLDMPKPEDDESGPTTE